MPVALLFPQEAQAYADDNSLLFMETSAKTAMNVNEIFMAIGTCHLNLTQGHIDCYVSKTFVDVTSSSKYSSYIIDDSFENDDYQLMLAYHRYIRTVVYVL